MSLKSEAARRRKSGRVIVLSGPSGAGKTTLHDRLLKLPEFKGRITRSISATTRPPRGNEKHGKDYLFLTNKMFERKIKSGEFLEWAKVFDRYYGTPLSNVRALTRQGKHVLLCIDVQGGQQVRKLVPDALLIFVKTRTLSELKKRLEGRKTDSPETVRLRLKTARQELKQARKYDHILVNDRLDLATRRLAEILSAELA